MLSDLTDPKTAALVTHMAVLDSDLDCRRGAAAVLFQHRPSVAVNLLRTHLLTAGDEFTRCNAAELLGQIGGQQAFEALARAFTDFTFRRVQECSARALGLSRDPAVIPLLKQIADDSFWRPNRKQRAGGSGIDIGQHEQVERDDVRVRCAALEGLACIGGDEARAIIRRHTKDADITVRMAAERLLRQAETPSK